MVYGRKEGQAALDTEGMQTMRTMANNMGLQTENPTRNRDGVYRQRKSSPRSFCAAYILD